MKKTCIASIGLLFNLFTLAAQIPAGNAPKNAQPSGGMGGKMPAIGRVYGKVYDESTKSTVGYASVVLLDLRRDSIIGGGLTRENGDFALENLPMGMFRLKISFLGYLPQIKQVRLMPPNVDLDLGNFYLAPEEKLLAEATVKTEKDRVQMTIDRRVYNVEKDILAQNGTAVDALKSVPAVTIDNDGNAQLRGGSPQIFVDGKPTNLLLNQIPAGEIERIEVITNPSAKFDANTTSGILNIVLKKNQRPGISGMVNAGIGTNNRYNAMTNLNIKQKPFNFSVSYNFNTSQNPTLGYTYRTNFAPDGAVRSYFNQENDNLGKHGMQFGRMSLDYLLDNRNTLTLSQNIMYGGHNNDEDQVFENLDAARSLLNGGDRVQSSRSRWRNYTTELAWRRTYPTPGKEWSTSVQFTKNRSKNDSEFSTITRDAQGAELPESPFRQINDGGQHGNTFIAQTDFSKPIGETGKFEIGAKTQRKINDSDNLSTYFDEETETWREYPLLALNYGFTEWISGAYANFSNKLSPTWRYQAGLRMEHSLFEGAQEGTDSTFSYQYPSSPQNLHKSLFPAIYFSKTLPKNAELQLNFSRKINRPGFFQTMPFRWVLDNQNIRAGNPNLRPEFVNIAEGNVSRTFGRGNILSSIYFKHTEDPVTTITVPAPGEPEILLTTFVNGDRQFNTGLENTLKIKVLKNFDATLNANLFYQNVAATYEGKSYQNDGFSGTGKLMLDYKFAKGWSSTLSGQYESPRVTPQGWMLANYFMDFGLKYELGPLASATFTASDIFNTKRMAGRLESFGLEQDFKRRREARYFQIGVMLRFGKPDFTLFKKRGGRPSGDMMDGGGFGF